MTSSSPRQRLRLSTAALLALAGLAAVLLAMLGAMRRPAGRAARSLEPVPDFEMTAVSSASERPLGRDDLIGRPWVANFIYSTCAGPCPMMTAQMASLQKALPSGVRLVSFTVDPDRDDPETLRRYAERFGAEDGRWLFLTGSKGPLFRLMREGFKLSAVEDPDAPEGYRVVHSTKFVLVDAAGLIRGYYDQARGLEALRQDAQALLRESSS